jgi:2'-5' RNA ligase
MPLPPLILTLAIEQEAFSFFNLLRQKHFPASRNFIDAHLTLFHALPNNVTIINAVRDICKQQKPFMLLIEEPVSIGKGVAYKIESPELRHLHKSLQQKWQQDLSPQDRQKLWPHITIQNKVRATDAKDLLDTLKTSFYPFSTTATGLQLWEYLGGPWKLIEEFVFEKEEA